MCAVFCSFDGIYDENIQQQSNILCRNGTGINLTKKKSTQKIWQKKQTRIRTNRYREDKIMFLCMHAVEKKNTNNVNVYKSIYIYIMQPYLD